MATDFAKELAELDALDRERAASSASSGPTLPPGVRRGRARRRARARAPDAVGAR